MTRDKLIFKDIIVFDDQWKITGWTNMNTKKSYICITCPCDIMLNSSAWFLTECDYRSCKVHPAIPIIVNTTYNLIK